MALLQALVCALAFEACKCANVRLAKIELKKMCGGEKRKYRRAGNKCGFTRCPFTIWSVCLWSPVKMFYFIFVFSCLFIVDVSFFRLTGNVLAA